MHTISISVYICHFWHIWYASHNVLCESNLGLEYLLRTHTPTHTHTHTYIYTHTQEMTHKPTTLPSYKHNHRHRISTFVPIVSDGPHTTIDHCLNCPSIHPFQPQNRKISCCCYMRALALSDIGLLYLASHFWFTTTLKRNLQTPECRYMTYVFHVSIVCVPRESRMFHVSFEYVPHKF